jgi:hypothetical protein
LPKVEVFKTERIEQPQNWSNDIAELENYFASIELPTQPVKLNRCSTITDCSLFIESHFATVKAKQRQQNLFTIPEPITGIETSINHKFKLI